MPNACCVKIRGNANEGRDRVTTTELPFATTDETNGIKDCTVCGKEAGCAGFSSPGCAASEALVEVETDGEALGEAVSEADALGVAVSEAVAEALAEAPGVAAPDGDA